MENQCGGDMGFIKLDRQLLNWGWFKKPEMVQVWVYLLLTAQHQDVYENGIFLKRGDVLFGRKKASRDLGLSEQTIRTCINRLKSTNEITTKSTNKYTIITILKYDDYQSNKQKSTNKTTTKLTSNQPTTNQQLTTYKNIRNKEYKNIDDVSIKRFKDIKNKWLEAGYSEDLVETAELVLKNKINEKSFAKVMGILTNEKIINPVAYIQTLKTKGEL